MRPRPAPVRLDAALPVGTTVGDATSGSTAVTGVTLDSRTVLPGDLYAALPGRHQHGASFAEQAVAAGAAAILTDPDGARMCAGLTVPVVSVASPRAILGGVSARIYGEPAARMQLLGVTGTNGKTTVATMIESGLAQAGRTTGLIGTVGLRIAGHWHAGVRTTPEATDLQATLAVMLEAGVESVVMEVSSIALEEHRVGGVRYDVAAFTNLSQDHLDYHGTMEEYYRAKAGLFAPGRCDVGVIGIDDVWGQRLADSVSVPHRTWSLLDPRADWRVERTADGLVVAGPEGERHRLVVPLPGAFNVANAICAYAVLRASGVAAEAAAAGIASAVVPGRMQVIGEVGGIRGIVDYAHSPDAIERVLRAAREDAEGRVIAVVGAGGDRDRTKRGAMGSTAARLADVLVITDDNPRSEDPASIRAAIAAGAREVAPGERAEVHEEGDRAAAVTVALGLAEAGDVVLVLGKGHEQGQESAGVVVPFDDATVLRAALDARSTT